MFDSVSKKAMALFGKKSLYSTCSSVKSFKSVVFKFDWILAMRVSLF
jgi:hypothetical protein